MRRMLRALIVVIIAVFAATFIDYAVHSTSEEFAVPGYYYRNKVLFGTLWAVVALYLFRRVRPRMKVVAIAAFATVLLQVRYFLEGYDLGFVVLFLFLHFLMFWAAFAAAARLFPEVMDKYL